MLLKDGAIAGVVVDDQRAQPGEVRAGQARQGRYRVGGGLEPHLEPKGRTAIHFAVDADLAAHQGGQLPANRETQTGAAVFARRERIGLAESIEYMSPRLLGYADARVD